MRRGGHVVIEDGMVPELTVLRQGIGLVVPVGLVLTPDVKLRSRGILSK